MRELKIIFSGIANAGKTSILQVLDDSFEVIPELKPTQNVEVKRFKVMGLDAAVWDMGAQKTYLEKYIQESQKYFAGTCLIFYVIDVRSKVLGLTPDDSLLYLKKLLATLDTNRQVYISILLHKHDPEVQGNEDYEASLEELKDNLGKMLASCEHTVFETSIYQPYTVFRAFSESILNAVSDKNIYVRKVQSIAEELNGKAAIMLTDAGHIYGEWYGQDVTKLEVAKFNRKVQEQAHLLSDKVYYDFLVIPFNSEYYINVIVFPEQEYLVLFCILVSCSKDAIEVKQGLLEHKRDLKQILKIKFKNEGFWSWIQP